MKHLLLIMLQFWNVFSLQSLNDSQLGECIETILDIYPTINLHLFQDRTSKVKNNLKDYIAVHKQRTTKIRTSKLLQLNGFNTKVNTTTYEFNNYNYTNTIPPVGSLELIVNIEVINFEMFRVIDNSVLYLEKNINKANIIVIDYNGTISKIDKCGVKTNVITQCTNLNLTILKDEFKNAPKDFKECGLMFNFVQAMPFGKSANHYANPLDVEILLVSLEKFNFSYVGATVRTIIYFQDQINDRGEPTYPYYISRYVMPVPLAKPIYGSINVFDLNFWILLLITFVVYVIAYYLLTNHTSKKGNDFSYILLQVFAVLFTQGVKFPARYLIKCVLLTWVFFSLILLNAYTGLSYQQGFQVAYEKQISTLEEIKNAKIDICIDLSKLKKSEQYFKMNECMRRQKKEVITMVVTTGTVFAKDSYEVYSHMKLVSVYIHFGHPIYTEFNKLLQRLVEDGLIQKWAKDAMFTPKPNDKKPFAPLTSAHLSPIFMLLIIGIIISALIFIFECFIGIIYKC